MRDLLGKFKAEDGFWECDTSMVRNSNDKLVCVAPAQPQNVELKHHKCQLIEGHHLFHSAQLLLHGIQASPLDLLHLGESRIFLVQILHPLERVSYFVSKRRVKIAVNRFSPLA